MLFMYDMMCMLCESINNDLDGENGDKGMNFQTAYKPLWLTKKLDESEDNLILE